MGDGSSLGFAMSDDEKGSLNNTSAHLSTTITSTSSLTLAKSKTFGIEDILLEKLVAMEKEQGIDAPYNFLIQSNNGHEKGIIHAPTSSLPFNSNNNYLHQKQEPRRRKPSATITSGALMTADEEPELLPNTNIKTEPNPGFVQQPNTGSYNNPSSSSTSTVTTIKTERTTVEMTTTEKYAEFRNPVVLIEPLTIPYPSTPPVQPPVFDPLPVIPPPVPPTTNPLADDVSNWIPFPIGKRKPGSTPFTPFQLEQLNHQMRMYTLANRLTIITKQNKPTSPRTRGRPKVTFNPYEIKAEKKETLDPVGTRTRGRPKKVIVGPPLPLPLQLPLPLPPPPPFKPQRGKKRAAPLPTTLTDILDWSPEPVKEVGRKKAGKGKRGPLIPDVPLVFVECIFCATSIPTFDSVTIESCQHTFCRECLRNFVENSLEPQIPCPIRDESKCNGVLSDPEIKGLVPDDIFQRPTI